MLERRMFRILIFTTCLFGWISFNESFFANITVPKNTAEIGKAFAESGIFLASSALIVLIAWVLSYYVAKAVVRDEEADSYDGY